MAQVPQGIQSTKKTQSTETKIPPQSTLETLIHLLPDLTTTPLILQDTTTHNPQLLEDNPQLLEDKALKSLLEESHTLKSTHQFNKPLTLNLFKPTKPTDSQRKYKLSPHNQSERKQDMNKESNP